MPSRMKKRKYKKKTERQKLIKELDAQTSKIVKKRDKGICQRCGRRGTETSHVVPRSNYYLRWNLNNLKWLCHRCHFFWWHKNPMAAWQWYQLEFPERADFVLEHEHDVARYSVSDLRDILEGIKNDK